MTKAFDASALDALFAAYDQGQLPGVAAGIRLGGRIVYRKAFGLARMELPLLLTPTMRMRIGSTSKHFGALAYMLLVEEGRAGLDDAVRKHLPELGPVADGVTMRHLMGHVGGLRCSLELVMQLSGVGHFASTGDQLRLIAEQDDVNFAPGERWSYSNGGYVLLTTVIERLSGQSLEDFLRTRIFEPVGMNDTMLRRTDTDFVANSASLHFVQADGSFSSQLMGPAIAAEGGIVSTVDDMLRWMAHMDAPVVGTTETWAAMATSQRLNGGWETGYGLGLMTGRYRGARMVHHPGGVFGGSSQMIKVPDHGLDIILITNRAGVDIMGLADKVIYTLVPDLDPLPESGDGTKFDGTYHDGESATTIRLYPHDGKQMISVGGADVPMRTEPDGSLVPVIPVFQVRVIAPDGEERPQTIRFADMGAEAVLHRIEPDPDASAAPFAGSYRSVATGSTAEIVEADGTAILTIAGRFGTARYILESLGGGLWKASSLQFPMPLLGGVVEFDASGLALTTGRTRRLRFEKA